MAFNIDEKKSLNPGESCETAFSSVCRIWTSVNITCPGNQCFFLNRAERPGVTECPTFHFISQTSFFSFFCPHAIALINYTSLVALATEVREHIT